MHRNRWVSLLVGVGLGCLTLGAWAPGASAVTASVAPSDTTVGLGNTFSIRVESDAFPDLKAYQLIFGYIPPFVNKRF